MNEPTVLFAGASATWTHNDATYTAPTYAARYVLVNDSVRIVLDSADSGASHKITIAPAVSASWTPGVYLWRLSMTDGTDSYVVAEGSVEIKAALTDATDTRSHARKVLASIEAVLEGRPDQADELQIDGRSLKRMPIRDLLHFRSIYRTELRAEDDAAKIAQGLGSRNQIRVRFAPTGGM